ncbi:MAG: RNA-binding cell elongation regulator Jag/EloR [Desulfosudaceae bacterium]
MASWSDFEGKTVDAALKKASKKLGVSVDNLNYEIIFAGSSGIFGLVGVKNARIRVDNGGSQADYSRKDRDEIQSLLDETFQDTAVSSQESEPRQKAKGPDKPDDKPNNKPQGKPTEKSVPARPPAVEVDEAILQLGEETLQRIVNVISEGAEIASEQNARGVLFNIEGGNAGVLIGKHGQTIKAMQHIVEKVMHKAQGEKIRVQVDVEKYIEKRRANLKSLATKLAEKAKQTGKPTIINRMDSFERKIIHDALRQDKEVKTRSTGGGDFRNVVIHPGKKTWPNKQSSNQ